MQLISKFNKGFRFLLCVIDSFSKYAWVVPLKDKKGTSIVNAFQIILKQSSRKPKAVNFIIVLLKNGYTKMILLCIHEGKSVVAEKFIRTLKNKIYKYMTSISKNVHIDKLGDIVNSTTIHVIQQLK